MPDPRRLLSPAVAEATAPLGLAKLAGGDNFELLVVEQSPLLLLALMNKLQVEHFERHGLVGLFLHTSLLLLI